MTQKSLTFDECKQLSSRIIAMNPNRRANMGQISSHLLDTTPSLPSSLGSHSSLVRSVISPPSRTR